MEEIKLVKLYEPPSGIVAADIVFIHGLGGNSKATWTASDAADDFFWPLSIAHEFPAVRVLSVEYPSSKLSSMFSGPNMSLLTTAASLLGLFQAYGVGKRPLVLITHSLGGLLAKALLRSASGAGELSKKAVANNTIGVAFIATPHTGSTLASIFSKIPGLPSIQVKDLTRATEVQVELYDWYRNNSGAQGIKTRAFYETQALKGILIVDAGSANPGTPLCDPTPVPANHEDICKPDGPDSLVCRSINNFLEEIFEEEHIDGIGGSLAEDLDTYITAVDGDRQSLEEKLTEAGRDSEIENAKREKERIAKFIAKNGLYRSARQDFRDFLSEVLGRFQLNVEPHFENDAPKLEINHELEHRVIEPMLEAEAAKKCKLSNYADIQAAVYYLTGNCHIKWTAKK